MMERLRVNERKMIYPPRRRYMISRGVLILKKLRDVPPIPLPLFLYVTFPPLL